MYKLFKGLLYQLLLLPNYNDYIVRLKKNCSINFRQTGRENAYVPETPMDLSGNYLPRTRRVFFFSSTPTPAPPRILITLRAIADN